jgi:hypothetical protein
MAQTVLTFIPLLACPLGMALMAGVPVLVHRGQTSAADGRADRDS